MFELDYTLKQFTQYIQANVPIKLRNDGYWSCDSWLVSWLFRFLSFFLPPVLKNITTFIKILDRLEQHSVRFGGSQVVDFEGYLNAGQAIVDKISGSKLRFVSRRRKWLQRRLIALRYRLEIAHPGDINHDLYQKIEKLAYAWKQNQQTFRYSNLLVQDIATLKEIARYEDFAKLLISDRRLQHKIFTYTLRDCLNVDIFIQFPALQEKLEMCNLQGRIGRMGGDLLKISHVDVAGEPNITEKIVTLPFENQPKNILDPYQVIHFRGHYSLTVAQIFAVFRLKTYMVGNLEFMAEGIVNWNVHQLGWWNADTKQCDNIPLSSSYWWRELPSFEIITRIEAKERYGNHMNGTVWNAAATSTRGTATLDYEQSHAYLEMAIPVDHEHYAIYDFGKFATRFPQNFLDSLVMLCQTLPATVAYPDENVYYTHRQHAQHSFALTKRQGQQLLELIRLDLIKARAGNMVYQIESENCAKWLHEKLEAAIGNIYNLFVMKLLDTEPFGAVKWIFKGIRYLPEKFQVPVLMAFHFLLGASHQNLVFENEKYIARSLSTHQFWETGEVFLPAYLHHQLEKGSLSLVAQINTPKPVSNRGVISYIRHLLMINRWFSSDHFMENLSYRGDFFVNFSRKFRLHMYFSADLRLRTLRLSI